MKDKVKHNVVGAKRKTLAALTLGGGMFAAMAALVLFAWMAEEVFEGESLAIDNTVRGYIHVYASDWLTRAMQGFSFLGSTLFLFPLVVLFVGFCVFTRRYRPGLILATVMSGAVILNYVLKVNFARARPQSYFDTPLPSSFSFPSGHALFSVCFYCTLAWVISSQFKSPVYRSVIWAVSIALAFFIGLSRIYLGVHYPSDVLAGFIAASIWLTVVAWANSIVTRTPDLIVIPKM